MTEIITTSSPGKVILFGEHAVNRGQSAISTTVDLRLYCRIKSTSGNGYEFRSGTKVEQGSFSQVNAFRRKIDKWRELGKLNRIQNEAQDFFAPIRYALAQIQDIDKLPKLVIEFRSNIPMGAGMGSGAAASSAMVYGLCHLLKHDCDLDHIAHFAWQADVIAHGGVSSSLDSSTCIYGGLLQYSNSNGIEPFSIPDPITIVIGNTLIPKSTAHVNTKVRKLLESYPEYVHIIKDIGFISDQAINALKRSDKKSLGHLMNLHQLLQEKLGTSWPKAEELLLVCHRTGAYGAKITGSGGGGVIIALADPEGFEKTAKAIHAIGGHAFITKIGVEGTRIEPNHEWE